MLHAFSGVYQGKTVLVTGHTGFKGSWLTLWLRMLGANVVGYALAPPTSPSMFDLSGLSRSMVHVVGDIRDYNKLSSVIQEHQPSILFHLAAQPIVLDSYKNPKETFDVNAGGTVNLLEAARQCSAIQAIVIVTTDKCYDNKQWLWGYRENDQLGGNDPYSSSKSMAELAAASYRSSFFQNGNIKLATARAGNVIGGGDFSLYRIVPDCMRALMEKRAIDVRNPLSIRPWLHVLDALSGYLQLGAKLIEEGTSFAEAWNFGPKEQHGVTVEEVVKEAIALWGEGNWIKASQENAKAEMGVLRLNWDKAANYLGWNPIYEWSEGLKETVDWYKAFHNGGTAMNELSNKQIQNYMKLAHNRRASWSLQNHFVGAEGVSV